MDHFKNVLLALFVFLFSSAPLALGAQKSQEKNVLVLFSFRPTLPVASLWDRGIQSVFNSDPDIKVDVNIEYLNLSRFKDPNYRLMIADVFRYKYSRVKPDLIIPIFEPALDFVLQVRNDLFPGVPIAFGAVHREYLEDQHNSSNLTGVFRNIAFDETLNLALDLHPNTRRVAVITGSGRMEESWLRSARKAFHHYTDRLDFTYLIGLPLTELQSQVATLPDDTIVIFLPVVNDRNGASYVVIDVLAQISKVSSVPIYSFWDVLLGHGIVGGYMDSYENKGRVVAEMGLHILKGASPGDIPERQTTDYHYKFDWHQLKQWTISEKQLPQSSIVKFKELTYLEKYRGRIIATLALFVIQAIIIIFLLHHSRIRRKAEELLRLAENKYRTVADYTYDWEYWLNMEGRFEYVSPSCERISGYSANEYLDTPKLMEEIILQEDQVIWSKHKERLRKGLKPDEIQFQIRRRDGAIRWIEHACQPVQDSKGNLSGFRASNRDISVRKVSELEVKRLKDVLEKESAYLQNEIKLGHNFENIIGLSAELKYVLHQSELVSSTDSSVLILGDTGTGKELIARAIHDLSPRKNRALVKVNCASLPSNLIENELFGHEKGAFTGADNRQLGRFELATGSTIFLDEIGEIPFELQAKLLQILESGEFERLGNPTTHKSDARIIAATNRDLQNEIKQGNFREDLLYRLGVFTITMPPLCKRTEDIPLLVQYFIEHFAKQMGITPPEVSKGNIEAMLNYHWPGNVRELKHIIESALITSRGNKLHIDLPKTSENPAGQFKTLQEMEYDYILGVLKAKNWKISGKDSASSVLGMHVSTLRARMKKLGITKSE